MKMVKSLLLGSAAGLVAVAGAQAADLPVKAKPVEYVKICSIYGAGFFYIPGTDTCIKIGGWVRAEYALGETGNSHAQFNSGGGGRNNRIDSNDSHIRARYGHLARRSHPDRIRHPARLQPLRLPDDHRRNRRTAVSTPNARFIQFAGFTFGKSQSYFDFVGGAVCYGCGYTGSSSQSGAAGTLARPPTRRRSATASPRRSSLEDGTHAPQRHLGCLRTTRPTRSSIGTIPGRRAAQDSGQRRWRRQRRRLRGALGIPDIVGSLRVDQAWGSAQISRRRTSCVPAATATTRPAPARTARPVGTPAPAADDRSASRSMAGIVINLPWAKGDKFYVEGAYS